MHRKRHYQCLLSLECNSHGHTHDIVLAGELFEKALIRQSFGRQALEDNVFHCRFEWSDQSIDISFDVGGEGYLHTDIEFLDSHVEDIIVVVLERKGH